MRGEGTRGGRRGGPGPDTWRPPPPQGRPGRALAGAGTAAGPRGGRGGEKGGEGRGGFSLPRGAGAARRAPPRGLGGGGTAASGRGAGGCQAGTSGGCRGLKRGRVVSSPPAGCVGGKSFPNGGVNAGDGDGSAAPRGVRALQP